MRCYADRQVRRSAVVILVSGILAVTVLAGLAAVLVEVAPGGPATRLLVVDTDAGADDAFALMEILRAEEMAVVNRWTGPIPMHQSRLFAVTCVMGNTGVKNVTKNVLATLEAASRLDVPVFSGASHPLLPPQPRFTNYFGEDGFGDFVSGTDAGKPRPEHAAVALVRMAKENPGTITLVCIGPLTNVALAIRLDPDFLSNLQDVYILGGVARGIGNAAPGAEFNVWMDPDAALVVFDAVPSNKPVFVLPWETVLDTEVPMTWRRGVLGMAGSATMTFLNLAERVALEQQSTTWESGDGLLAAYLVDGRVATAGKPVRLSVLGGAGGAGGVGRGVSLVDYSNTTQLPANTILIEKPDATAFQRTLLRLLS